MNQNQKPIRILHIVSSMCHGGGVQALVLNLYRNLDHSQVQFDFVSHDQIRDNEAEVNRLGGRIFYLPSMGKLGMLKYLQRLIKLIKENGPYHGVHAHTIFQCGIVMLAAKIAGVPKRVCHSHNTSTGRSGNFFFELSFPFFKFLMRHCATNFLACGVAAGRFLYGDQMVEAGRVLVLPNAIDLEPYRSLTAAENNTTREALQIPEDALVLGHVGRFAEQKNHRFFIPFMEELLKKHKNTYLLLVGNGELETEIKQRVQEAHLEGQIRFLGLRRDIPQLLNAFDLFVLPSLFEGLPFTLVETQAAGLPCLVAATVTNEVDVGLGLLNYVKLDEDLAEWVNQILAVRQIERPSWEEREKRLKEHNYEISASVALVMKVYEI